jgi:hypothetical protein
MSRIQVSVSKPRAAESGSGLRGWERKCADFRAPWQMAPSGERQLPCPKCDGWSLVEKALAPIPFERGPPGNDLEVSAAGEADTPKPAADELAVLGRVAALGRFYIEALADADVVSRRMVSAGVGESRTTGYMQLKSRPPPSTGRSGFCAPVIQASIFDHTCVAMMCQRLRWDHCSK